MGFDTVLPSIRKANPTDPGLVAAKIGWMELNQGFVLMCMSILSYFLVPPLHHWNNHFIPMAIEVNNQQGFSYLRIGTENHKRERNESGLTLTNINSDNGGKMGSSWNHRPV